MASRRFEHTARLPIVVREAMNDPKSNTKILVEIRLGDTGDGCVNLKPYLSLFENKKDNADDIEFLDHIPWELPTEYNPSECPDGTHFDIYLGDYKKRLKNVGTEILRYINEFIDLVDGRDSAVIANFILYGYFIEQFLYAPRLIIKGTSGSGKSRVFSVLNLLCHRAIKAGNATHASAMRFAHEFCPTLLLDEFQDTSKSEKTGIQTIVKEGFVHDGRYIRAETNGKGYFPQHFRVFCPLAIVYKEGYLPEDIENRALTINMVQTEKKMPIALDEKRATKIRNELYTLRALWIAYPQSFDLQSTFDEVCDNLERGVTYVEGKPLGNRARDMGSTLLTIARFAETLEEDVYTKLQEAEIEGDGAGKDTFAAQTFGAMLRCDTFANKSDFIDKLSTREVAMKLYGELIEDGEDIRMDRGFTRRVTDSLKSLGFDVKRGTDNKSFITYNEKTDKVFHANLQKFGTENDKKRFLQ